MSKDEKRSATAKKIRRLVDELKKLPPEDVLSAMFKIAPEMIEAEAIRAALAEKEPKE